MMAPTLPASLESHPLGVRELKPLGHVARGLAGRSHPLGVRELKLGDVWQGRGYDMSHPLGVRELKLRRTDSSLRPRGVAPFRGA